MSIRPIDMQLAVQKSAELGKLTPQEGNRFDAAHHHFAQKFQKEIEHNDHQVMQANKSEGGHIDKDGKNENHQKQSKRENKKDDKAEDDSKSKDGGNSCFDVSI